MIIFCYNRVAQILAAWQHGCEKMEREWENDEDMERMRKLRGNGQRMRKWTENEEMKRDSLSTFLIFSLFPPFLSISYIKNCLILSQNVKYDTVTANVIKNLSYALWENNSESNSLWENSASCEGLSSVKNCLLLFLTSDHVAFSHIHFLICSGWKFIIRSRK